MASRGRSRRARRTAHVDVQVGRRRPGAGRGRGAARSGWRGARPSGLGAQHVVAMFGATFVFPLVMGLDPNLAIMFSGICTILFLLICKNKVPSYLGTSASFVGRRRRDPRREGGDSADVTGAILVAGIVLAWSACCVHFVGAAADPQGAAARRHRRGRHADRLQPRPGRGQHLLAAGPVGRAADRGVHGRARRCCFPGFWSRIAMFLGLIFGYVLSWLVDASSARSPRCCPAGRRRRRRTTASTWAGVEAADWFGFPSGDLADGVVRRPRAQLLADVHPARCCPA